MADKNPKVCLSSMVTDNHKIPNDALSLPFAGLFPVCVHINVFFCVLKSSRKHLFQLMLKSGG